MKLIYKIGLGIVLLTGIVSCRKFLDVKPIDSLSGNDFWKTQEDALHAISGAYSLLLAKFTQAPMYNVGDFRPGNWNWFAKVNLMTIADNDLNNPDINLQDNASAILDWSVFYQSIAECNLAIDRIPGIDDPGFSEGDKRALVAEARFIRDFTYFYMVRLYSDVPLQLDPYDTSPKPRVDMLTVLDTCLADLETAKNDLPVSYTDPTNRAVRATQGAALTLMANIYMWKAGFDKANQKAYWQKAADLAKQVMDLGAYRLVPYTKETFPDIFKGRSEEGIFELSLDINYGEQFHGLIAQWVLHEPIIHSNGAVYGGYGSEITAKREFLDQLYPSGIPDDRFTLWFDDPYSTKNPQSAMFLKFSAVSNPSTRDYDANFILFRYAGLILLRAEALADLGDNGPAIELLNMIRQRANTPPYVGGGGPALQDAIFLEREKELMGEGDRWYTLIRTGRITDQKWCETHLTQQEMQEKAWTWPIATASIQDNPLVSQNPYWAK
ncbi:RagB/SusD family nutrient uptake outer membrane protein [Compostibacter hankyongensis]